MIFGITLNFILNTSKSHATMELSAAQSINESLEFTFNQTKQNSNSDLNFEFNRFAREHITRENIISSKLPLLPETVNLVKDFEGFRASAYLDTSGLPVIGYGLTRVDGRTVRLGQYITPAQADIALEQELEHIQRIVQSKVKVELNPYQIGALSSLVYNAGTRVITNSTLIKKLNAGDYAGAAREFPRWNKANRGGRLVVFPGLTKRRLAEQQLFLTPYEHYLLLITYYLLLNHCLAVLNSRIQIYRQYQDQSPESFSELQRH